MNYNTLNKNHIEIPFPQRDVYVRHVEMPKEGKKSREEKSKAKELEAVDSPESAEVTEPTPTAEQPAKRKRRKPSRKPETKAGTAE